MSQVGYQRAQAAAIPIGAAAALVAVAIWVALTARTGVTYHHFPLAIVAAVGFMSRTGGPPFSRLEAAVTAAVGLIAVALGWLTLVLLDQTPTATFVAGQTGGVPGETALFALLGAALSVWWVRRGR
jgi:hypothetical protein